MASTSKSSKMLKSIGILSMGIMLTLGGLFVWQGQFNLNFFSEASTKKISHIVVLGDSVTSKNGYYAEKAHKTLESDLGRSLTYVDLVKEGVTLPLKDQTVTAYQELPQPIAGKVAFFILSGQETVRRGLANGDSAHLIASRYEKEIRDMLSIASDRPGIFPDGIVVYISDMYDPTDGIVGSSSCNKDYPYTSETQLEDLKLEMDTVLNKISSQNIGKIQIVSMSDSVIGHAAGAASDSVSWFTNCYEMNEVGNSELAKAFVETVNKTE